MILTEHQKNELDAVADSVSHYIADHLRETISWQTPNELIDTMNDGQFIEALDYTYNKVLKLITE